MTGLRHHVRPALGSPTPNKGSPPQTVQPGAGVGAYGVTLKLSVGTCVTLPIEKAIRAMIGNIHLWPIDDHGTTQLNHATRGAVHLKTIQFSVDGRLAIATQIRQCRRLCH